MAQVRLPVQLFGPNMNDRIEDDILIELQKSDFIRPTLLYGTSRIFVKGSQKKYFLAERTWLVSNNIT